MLFYVADLKRNSWIKYGICQEDGLADRLADLRREFGAETEIFLNAPIPDGWGTPQNWELRFKEKILRPRHLHQLESLDQKERNRHITSYKTMVEGREGNEERIVYLELFRCGDRAELVDVDVSERKMLWQCIEYPRENSGYPPGPLYTEVIVATQAEATIAFRELMMAADCGSAMPAWKMKQNL
jgi:hypothetical protein